MAGDCLDLKNGAGCQCVSRLKFDNDFNCVREYFTVNQRLFTKNKDQYRMLGSDKGYFICNIDKASNTWPSKTLLGAWDRVGKQMIKTQRSFVGPEYYSREPRPKEYISTCAKYLSLQIPAITPCKHTHTNTQRGLLVQPTPD